jgi:hypothetical protein
MHACPNDCILYCGIHENLDEWPVCHASRYKILRDDPGDVEDEERLKKRIPAKVMWYAPIIPRLNDCSEIRSMQSCCDGTKKTVR